MDRLLAAYRPSIRGKKWYWPLFTNALNVSVVAAWRLHCLVTETPLSHLEFRRDITLCLLKSDSHCCNQDHITTEAPLDVRCDGQDHFKQQCKQGRCVICKKKYQVSVCQMSSEAAL